MSLSNSKTALRVGLCWESAHSLRIRVLWLISLSPTGGDDPFDIVIPSANRLAVDLPCGLQQAAIYTLTYLRDPRLQRDIHRSQNRIEAYHQLRSTIAQAGGKKQLIGRPTLTSRSATSAAG